MKYTHIVNAYYSKLNSSSDLKPLNRDNENNELAGFMASNLKQNENYITFESMNAWGQITESKFHIDNIIDIKEIK